VSATDLIQSGKILKSIRLKGEILCSFEPFSFTESFSPEVFFIGEKNPLPYFIEKIEITDKRLCILKIEDIDSKEKADALSGKVILMRSADMKAYGLVLDESLEEEYSFHDYSVIDSKAGAIGKIISVYEARGNIVAECTSEDGSIMIPLHPDLIIKIDKENKTLHTDFPEGLTEL